MHRPRSQSTGVTLFRRAHPPREKVKNGVVTDGTRGATVTIGGYPATITRITDNLIEVNVPLGPAEGERQVKGDNSRGSDGGPVPFNLLAATPSIAGVSPASVQPGDTVALHGMFFSPANDLPAGATVLFGAGAVNVQPVSDTEVRAQVPPHLEPGDVGVRIQTAMGGRSEPVTPSRAGWPRYRECRSAQVYARRRHAHHQRPPLHQPRASV